jgi:hypothetical protein
MTVENNKEELNLPSSYAGIEGSFSVLFLGGGGSTLFLLSFGVLFLESSEI